MDRHNPQVNEKQDGVAAAAAKPPHPTGLQEGLSEVAPSVGAVPQPPEPPTGVHQEPQRNELLEAADWLLQTVMSEVASNPMWAGNLPDSTAREKLGTALAVIKKATHADLFKGAAPQDNRVADLEARLEEAQNIAHNNYRLYADATVQRDGLRTALEDLRAKHQAMNDRLDEANVSVDYGDLMALETEMEKTFAILDRLPIRTTEDMRAAAALRACEGIPSDLLEGMSPGIFVHLSDRSCQDREAARALREVGLAIATSPALSAAVRGLDPEAYRRFCQALAGVDDIGGAHRGEGPAPLPHPTREPFLEDLPGEQARNERRAAWAREAMSVYAARTGLNLDHEADAALQDLLGDLHHMADVDGLDYEEGQEQGAHRYAEEVALARESRGTSIRKSREVAASRLKAGQHEIYQAGEWQKVQDVEPWEDTKVLIHLPKGARIRLNKDEKVLARKIEE